MSIKPSRLTCLPLPVEAEGTATIKTMTVRITNPPKTPEEAMDYRQLWAGFVNGITIPETFTRIFDIIGCSADTNYFYCMAMGYAEHRRMIAANQGHLQHSAVLAILINLAVLRQQSPRFPQIYSQVLQREPNLPVNTWEQAHHIVTHPAYPRNDLGLMFEAPSSTSLPWVIWSTWREDQLNTLVLGLRPSIDTLQNLLAFADAFIHTRPASNPFEGTSLEGQTPQTMFLALFITANPMEGTLAPPLSATPSAVPPATLAATPPAALTAAPPATLTTAPPACHDRHSGHHPVRHAKLRSTQPPG